MVINPHIISYTVTSTLRSSRLQKFWSSLSIIVVISTTFLTFWLNIYNTTQAETLNYSWANRFGSTSGDTGNAIVTDSDGNVYIVGAFSNTVDFDPGAGTSNLTSVSGTQDIFILKLDTNGNLVWVKGVGAGDSDNAQSVALDSDGNVYIAGYYSATVDFDPGAGTSNLTSAGLLDLFLLKLDNNGNFIWVKGMGDTLSDASYGVKVDANNDVLYAGYFRGTVDFDPGAGTTNLVAAGGSDIFISKLDSDGNFIWAKNMGGSNNEFLYGFRVGSNGSTYATGEFTGTADFDPGAGTSNLVSVSSCRDIFISKLDTDGNFAWAKSLGGSSTDIGYSIAVDSDDNVFTVGGFAGTADFDPGAGTSNLTSAGGNDIFISKLDDNGSFVSVTQIGGSSTDDAFYIDITSDDSKYLTGRFSTTVDFDPGGGTSNLTSGGGNDIFLMSLDSSNSLLWAQSRGSTGFDSGNAIKISAQGNVYATGFFSNTVDFDPGAGTNNLTSAGFQDIYVTKLTIVDVPTVSTSAATGETEVAATINGNVTNTGNLDITDRGFDYGLTVVYTDQVGESGTYGTGTFSSALSGLTCATTYHYRAFATNSQGTSYGSDATFTTLACPVAGGSSGSRRHVDGPPGGGLAFPIDITPITPIVPGLVPLEPPVVINPNTNPVNTDTGGTTSSPPTDSTGQPPSNNPPIINDTNDQSDTLVS